RMPPAAWAAGALAIAAAVAAFANDFSAALLMVLAGVACYAALREARRFIITSRSDDAAEAAELSELAPLLEALPDPALLIDDEARIVGSNAAARQQM